MTFCYFSEIYVFHITLPHSDPAADGHIVFYDIFVYLIIPFIRHVR